MIKVYKLTKLFDVSIIKIRKVVFYENNYRSKSEIVEWDDMAWSILHSELIFWNLEQVPNIETVEFNLVIVYKYVFVAINSDGLLVDINGKLVEDDD